MTPAPSDPWLELIHALRAQTGIQPIPLSEAEKRSGLVTAFAAAVAPGCPEPPPAPPEPGRAWIPKETRPIILARIRQALSAWPQTTEQPVTPAPAESPALPPRRAAVHLAAYRKR